MQAEGKTEKKRLFILYLYCCMYVGRKKFIGLLRDVWDVRRVSPEREGLEQRRVKFIVK